MQTATRDRLVDAGAELLRRQGYSATGVKQIVEEAKAPIASLYHFFPGGKEQLGAEAIRKSGASYELLIPAIFDVAPDPVTGVRMFFAGAAEHLVETDYEDACPIATVALEVSSSSEVMREACAEVFASWIAAGSERYPEIEGAFVLARAQRSTEALLIAGEMVAGAVQNALSA
jgi:AcrR family transcriptional regulator